MAKKQARSKGNRKSEKSSKRPSARPKARPATTSAGPGLDRKPARKAAPATIGKGSSNHRLQETKPRQRAPIVATAEPDASATALDPIQFPEELPRKIKTPLTAKELREFKELLLQKRAETCGDVQRLTSEALHRNSNGTSDHGTMPIHMADLGTDTWEQDFTLGLIANEEALVRDIDEALARIADRTYGVCLATGKPITLARLRAKPWAKYCIEYARAREEGRAI